ncbi:lactate racemase domain-containing protein [Rubinisphaera sp. JC750]|uniref:lactate racemase domain-containing protein n=1 Tax=Rubinisphaera sp. JC750 TaxID=2898658 RepID=UPI001F3AB8E1|nr:lactate racemase domain-containing protein [Rubinisphaera sp. JC750]
MDEIQLHTVSQSPPTPVLEDVAGQTAAEIDQLLDLSNCLAGQRIGLAVGSRGIARLPEVVRVIVERLQARQLVPVILPAMGSHGGATPAGQTDVLRRLGIDPSALGVDIDADMATEVLGTTADGTPVQIACSAMAVDHVLLCNRVKPHTRFTGSTQSGLLKMLVIGLGKHAGAAAYHRATHHVCFDDIVATAVPLIRSRVSVLGGLAVIENARDEVAEVTAVSMDSLPDQEPALLNRAESLMPRLPLKEIDLLIVDQIGKEISGTGMDTNVIGRKANDHVSGPDDWCHTHLIYVRGLTAATAGNANGIGMAEFVRDDVLPTVDWRKTSVNAITAGHPTAAMCPVSLPSDRDVLEAALSILGPNPRIVHIRNTLQLSSLLISDACLPQIPNDTEWLQVSQAGPIRFDSAGNFAHSRPF